MTDASEILYQRAHFYPTVVIESRWREKIYHGEISFFGKHYVVSPNCKSREEAIAATQPLVDKIAKAMEIKALEFLSKYPEAKE